MDSLQPSQILISSLKSLLFTLLLILCGCGQQSQPQQVRPAHKTSSSPVTAPVDYISTTIKTGEQSKGAVETAVIQKTIEAFQAGEGRFPESLNELIEKSYLNVLPQAPQGMEFQYDAQSGKFEIIPKASD